MGVVFDAVRPEDKLRRCGAFGQSGWETGASDRTMGYRRSDCDPPSYLWGGTHKYPAYAAAYCQAFPSLLWSRRTEARALPPSMLGGATSRPLEQS